MASPLNSTATISTAAAAPTPFCPNSQYTVSWNGTLPAIGEVCQITLSPKTFSIKACCKSNAQIFITQNDCVQYCETEEKNFMQCVTDQLTAAKIEYSSLGTMCQSKGKAVSSSAVVSGSATMTSLRPSVSATGVGSGAALTRDHGAGYTFAMVTVGVAVGFGVLGLM